MSWIKYSLFAALFVAGLVLYWTKPAPAPQVIYIDNTDTTKVWQNKADSLQKEVVRFEAQVVRLKSELVRTQKEKEQIRAGLREMTPTQQVESFGRSTGDSTITMRAQDSVALVPLACIVQANILFADGQAAKKEADTLHGIVQVQGRMIQTQAKLLQADKEYISFMEQQIAKNLADRQAADAQLVKQKSKTRAWVYTAGAIGLALLGSLAVGH